MVGDSGMRLLILSISLCAAVAFLIAGWSDSNQRFKIQIQIEYERNESL